MRERKVEKGESVVTGGVVIVEVGFWIGGGSVEAEVVSKKCANSALVWVKS